MAYIDHVHVRASDPAKTIEFFSKFFGAIVTQEFENLGRKITVLSMGDKSRVCVLHLPPLSKNMQPEAPVVDHIGIVVERIEQLVGRLKEDGFTFSVDLTRSFDGNKIAFFHGPDHLQIEIFEPSA